MHRLWFIFLLMAVAGCKEKYIPKVNQTTTNYLVVDGTINTGTGPTSIRLSRTTKMTDTVRFNPETGATVSVQGDDNSSFPLSYKGAGVYAADQLTLNNTRQYRVHIKTKDGKEYASDFVEVKTTPVIDSISWVRRADGVHIFANTHDAQNKTRYYRWEFEETWEQRSRVVAKYDYVNKKVVEIDPFAVNIFYCWKSNPSTSLLLGSSAALASDIISLQPLTKIVNADERLAVRYSILVRQYALTKSGYEFYTLMKKNTEQLGDIFGPLPTEITGNVRSLSDPNDKVIGFVSASTIQEKRIFITDAEVPGWNFSLDCGLKTVPNVPDSIQYYFDYMYRPYDALVSGSGAIESYFGITPVCADCRKRGGVNVKPSFW